MHFKPKEQISLFLNWFKEMGIKSFDIHIRKPKGDFKNFNSKNWVWLTHNENQTSFSGTSKIIKWALFQNSQGADVFFRPHKNDPQPMIFLDDLSFEKAITISKKYSCCLVETSPNSFHVWLACDKPLVIEERKKAQTNITQLGWGDSRSTSGDHLGRLCGVKSQKNNCWVNLKLISRNKRFRPSNLERASLPRPRGGACVQRVCSRDTSPSGQEFVWALQMISRGRNPIQVELELYEIALARGKRSARSYASRTIKKLKEVIDQKFN